MVHMSCIFSIQKLDRKECGVQFALVPYILQWSKPLNFLIFRMWPCGKCTPMCINIHNFSIDMYSFHCDSIFLLLFRNIVDLAACPQSHWEFWFVHRLSLMGRSLASEIPNETEMSSISTCLMTVTIANGNGNDNHLIRL